jgi:hypothetical protein
MKRIYRLRANDRLPQGTWSHLQTSEVENVLHQARDRGLFASSMSHDRAEQLTLELLADRYGKVLYRQHDKFYKPSNSKGREIDWSKFQG